LIHGSPWRVLFPGPLRHAPATPPDQF
jgi:hypothetical protein